MRKFLNGPTLLVVLAILMSLMVGADAATRILLMQLRGLPGSLVGIGTTGIGQNVTVGQGLTYANGTLSANQSSATVRQYAVLLTRDPAGFYIVPTAVQTKPVFYRNGLRQTPTEDYSYVSGVLSPNEPWGTDDLVTCDGEQ